MYGSVVLSTYDLIVMMMFVWVFASCCTYDSIVQLLQWPEIVAQDTAKRLILFLGKLRRFLQYDPGYDLTARWCGK